MNDGVREKPLPRLLLRARVMIYNMAIREQSNGTDAYGKDAVATVTLTKK
jgi:hypothetical protein